MRRASFTAWAALAAALCGCGGEEQPKRASELVVTFVDVGQGDAALVELPNGEAILVDGGGDGHGAGDVLPLLEEKGISALALVVATHPHADHIGGLDEILSAVEVDEIWDNGEAADTASYRRFAERAAATGAAWITPQDGEQRRFGAVTVIALGRAEEHAAANDGSVVVQVTYGETDVLFTGDAEAARQEELGEEYGRGLASEVVKVPHHGSASFDPGFVDDVGARLAVISCGRDNPYGHPSAAAVATWSAGGAAICRTDELGDVVVATDGAALEASCGTP